MVGIGVLELLIVGAVLAVGAVGAVAVIAAIVSRGRQ